MVLAREARRPPRQIADLIVRTSRASRGGPGRGRRSGLPQRLPLAGLVRAPGAAHPGRWAPTTAAATPGAAERMRVEFVSANPTGPLVIVNARAAAVGDALVRLLRQSGGRGRRPSTTSTTPAPRPRRWPGRFAPASASWPTSGAPAGPARRAPAGERLSWRVPDRSRPALSRRGGPGRESRGGRGGGA